MACWNIDMAPYCVHYFADLFHRCVIEHFYSQCAQSKPIEGQMYKKEYNMYLENIKKGAVMA